MTIAFDLDNTLIPYTSNNQFPVEARTLLRKLFQSEPLRMGTIKLFKSLKSNGHDLWIYTSSERSESYIRKTFLLHGIKLDGVINQQKHNLKCKKEGISFSKYPPAFGIDLLIDDSHGVELEGREGNFKTLIIASDNTEWVKKVLDETM